ncbi:MAG: alpha/beta hydrolase, partial [Sphingobium sp.]
MASQLIANYYDQIPPLPVDVPSDEFRQMRTEMERYAIEQWPILPGVTMETVSFDGTKAIWYRPPDARSDQVILYIHGGGFMWCSAEGHQGVISRVAAATGCPALAIDYEVAPFARFPSQIDECARGYNWLLDQGYPAGKIAIVGDSAGGGLVLSTIVALKRDNVPLPGCICVSSSWADLTNSGESIDWVTTDPCVSREGLEFCRQQYLQGHDPKDPLASPLLADVHGFPPSLVQVAARERLLSDSIRYASKADAAGVEVKLEVYDG